LTLVFLDTETTGLDNRRHEVWEIAYAVDDGPILSSFVSHSPAGANPFALEVNGYYDRFKGEPFLGLKFEAELRERLAGATLVGANPAFDAGFLEARWGEAPWHYRMLDIESYAVPILGFDKVQGLKDIREGLDFLGFAIPDPDHTAAGDVATLRASYNALKALAKERLYV
jgi:DNA polymerase III epsilon subunit-like protein